MRIIIKESQLKSIIENTKEKANFIDWRSAVAGQPIFDYVRKHEKFVPYTYDDAYFPPKKFTKGKTKKGTLTIGYGTTNPDYAFPGNVIDKSPGEKISQPDIQNAADCIKRWQSRVKKDDKNQRKITRGMYFVMTDMVYNIGCSAFINSPTLINHIEKGNYKSASKAIKDGNWGHPERREEASKLFCEEGVC